MSPRALRRPGALGALTLLLLAAAPARAAAISLNPCDWTGVSSACGAVKSAVSGAASWAGGQIFEALTRWVVEGAAWLVREVARGLDATTRVELGAQWFTEHYRFMLAAGALVLLPFLLLAVIQGLLAQDASIFARAAFLHLPAAMLLTGGAVAVTQGAVAATDALSAELAAGIARDAGAFAAHLVPTLSSGPVPLFVGLLVGALMAVAALFVWLELLLRSAAIYVALMFLPLFLCAAVWPRAAGWARRLAELLGALVLLKLVIVATLSLGLSAFTSGAGVSSVLSGAAIFCLAAFSPAALLWLIPLAGEVAQGQRQARGGLAAASGAALGWQAARARIAASAGGGGRPGALGMSGAAGAAGGGRADAALGAATAGAPAGGGARGRHGGSAGVGPTPPPPPTGAPGQGGRPTSAGTPRGPDGPAHPAAGAVGPTPVRGDAEATPGPGGGGAASPAATASRPAGPGPGGEAPPPWPAGRAAPPGPAGRPRPELGRGDPPPATASRPARAGSPAGLAGPGASG